MRMVITVHPDLPHTENNTTFVLYTLKALQGSSLRKRRRLQVTNKPASFRHSPSKVLWDIKYAKFSLLLCRFGRVVKAMAC